MRITSNLGRQSELGCKQTFQFLSDPPLREKHSKYLLARCTKETNRTSFPSVIFPRRPAKVACHPRARKCPCDGTAPILGIAIPPARVGATDVSRVARSPPPSSRVARRAGGPKESWVFARLPLFVAFEKRRSGHRHYSLAPSAPPTPEPAMRATQTSNIGTPRQQL